MYGLYALLCTHFFNAHVDFFSLDLLSADDFIILKYVAILKYIMILNVVIRKRSLLFIGGFLEVCVGSINKSKDAFLRVIYMQFI